MSTQPQAIQPTTKNPSEPQLPLVWVIENDSGTRFTISESFGQRFRIVEFCNVAEWHMTNATECEKPDVLIADLKLPDGFFLNVMADSPEISQIPTVVISALDDAETIDRAFSLGVADYLSKPFSKTLLLAKVERLLKPAKGPCPDSRSNSNDMELPKIPETLTAMEKRLFETLWSNQNRDARSLCIGLYGEHSPAREKTLKVHLCRLKKKLMESGWRLQAGSTYHLERLDLDNPIILKNMGS
jgi:DNA-binding response OmpR family regulator